MTLTDKQHFTNFLNYDFGNSGLKKKEYASKIGISRVYLDSLLSGKSEPKLSTAVDILKKLGYDLEISKKITIPQ